MPSTITLSIPKLGDVRKALAAGVAALLPLAISDALGNHWTAADIGGLATAFLVAVGGVYGIRNGAKPAAKNDAGLADTTIIAISVAVIATVSVLAFFGVHGR